MKKTDKFKINIALAFALATASACTLGYGVENAVTYNNLAKNYEFEVCSMAYNKTDAPVQVRKLIENLDSQFSKKQISKKDYLNRRAELMSYFYDYEKCLNYTSTYGTLAQRLDVQQTDLNREGAKEGSALGVTLSALSAASLGLYTSAFLVSTAKLSAETQKEREKKREQEELEYDSYGI